MTLWGHWPGRVARWSNWPLLYPCSLAKWYCPAIELAQKWVIMGLMRVMFCVDKASRLYQGCCILVCGATLQEEVKFFVWLYPILFVYIVWFWRKKLCLLFLLFNVCVLSVPVATVLSIQKNKYRLPITVVHSRSKLWLCSGPCYNLTEECTKIAS